LYDLPAVGRRSAANLVTFAAEHFYFIQERRARQPAGTRAGRPIPAARGLDALELRR